MPYRTLLIGAFAALLSASARAGVHDTHHHEHHHSAPPAPVGVMGEHIHSKGRWMFSYRQMRMGMDGNLSGSDNISADEIAMTANPLAGERMRMGNLPDGSPRIMTVPPTYRIAPLSMDMDMHMFGAMYGLNDDITLMAMANYVEKEMTLRTYGGPMGTNAIGTFTGKTSGFGDTKVSALIKMGEKPGSSWHLNLGVSLPTGSIDEKGRVLPPFAGMMIPAGQTVDIDRLAYPMQLGSGTVDLLTGATYSGYNGTLGWGAQLSTILRLYDNSEDYRLGNKVEATAWLANQWNPVFSSSLRLKGFSEGRIRGRDPVITGGMPLFAAENSGRDQIDLLVGITLSGKGGVWKGQSLSLEGGIPAYQKVNGIQMKNDWQLTAGYEIAF